eukprot:570737-Pleurochrysis_carterae.AAC.1
MGDASHRTQQFEGGRSRSWCERLEGVLHACCRCLALLLIAADNGSSLVLEYLSLLIPLLSEHPHHVDDFRRALRVR